MIANIIASFSLLLSITLAFIYLRDRRYAKFQVENDYTNNLLKWHDEVVTILLKLKLLHNHRQHSLHIEDLARLSALIEQGRFFFPNIKRSDEYGRKRSDEYGRHKPDTYQGYRNYILEFLVDSYTLFIGKASKNELQKAERLQRDFTSAVFEIVMVKKRLKTIQSLTGRLFYDKRSREDFLDYKDNSPQAGSGLQP